MSDDPGATVPLFMTHHAPPGAWASLTLGLNGHGVGIEHEALRVTECANLLAGVSRDGQVTVLPFISGVEEDNDAELANLGGTSAAARDYRVISSRQVRRILTPALDSFSAAGISLRIHTPHFAIPDPTAADVDDRALARALCPGLLIELEIDNRAADTVAWGVLGLLYTGTGRIRPLDWTTPGDLCGVGFRQEWALAARAVPGRVGLARDNNIFTLLRDGRFLTHNAGNQGALLCRVPAGEVGTLRAAFGFFHEGAATQGLVTRYAYRAWHSNVESVCRQVLRDADAIKDEGLALDDTVAQSGASHEERALFAQALRAYTANQQVLRDDDGDWHVSLCEGQFCWRNTLDLAADHLPWELWRNPWVVRSIMDDFIERYSYRDRVRLPDEPGRYHAGGLAFTHDMGSYTAYAPPGEGGYEMPGAATYSFMTTEQVLNGVFCLAAYGLTAAGTDAWLARRVPVLTELLESLERRDHPDPARRDGLLKGETSRVGAQGHEITTYDALDPALKATRGNLYVAVKTWCAGVMLEAVLGRACAADAAARAGALAVRAAGVLERAFDAARGCWPANLLAPAEAYVLAAIEPLAIPWFCGLGESLRAHAALWHALRRHTETCLAPGRCLQSETGGMLLSSGTAMTWPSKAILCAFVARTVLGLDLNWLAPRAMREFLHWTQVAAGATTISDQILADRRHAHAGHYYPRLVTSALWIRPRCDGRSTVSGG